MLLHATGPGERGLTLLEILVATAFASLIAVMALPGLGEAASAWRLAAAARQIVLDLKVTRVQAISENTDRRLRLPFPASAYRRERREESGAYVADGPPIALPSGVAVVDCTANGGAITFRPLGHASTFGTIILRNESGDERRVVVDIAGRLRVE